MPPISATQPKVIVVTPWYGGNEGGVAVVTESLVRSLVDAGVPCAVIQMMADGWKPQTRLGNAGEKIVSVCVRDQTQASGLVSKVGARIRDILATRALKSLLPTDGRGCVVHFHYAVAEYDLFVKLCTRWRIPMVSTFHGSDIVVNMGDARNRSVTRERVTRSFAVTTVSEALRQTTLALFPEIADHAYVVHNAVPPSFIDAAAVAPFPPSRDLDVLFVGNLVALKGVDVLIRAWASVLTEAPQARLTIAGHGPLANELPELANSLGIGHAIKFVGRQSRAELPVLYRRARVLAVPSRTEALGVVILEGQLSGAAIVASNVGGIPEVVKHGETGLLVPADNPELLARALLELLNNAEYRDSLAAAGTKQVEELFTAEHIGDQYLELYRRSVKPS